MRTATSKALMLATVVAFLGCSYLTACKEYAEPAESPASGELDLIEFETLPELPPPTIDQTMLVLSSGGMTLLAIICESTAPLLMSLRITEYSREGVELRKLDQPLPSEFLGYPASHDLTYDSIWGGLQAGKRAVFMSQRTGSQDAVFLLDSGNRKLGRLDAVAGGRSLMGLAVAGDSLYVLLRPTKGEITAARRADSELPVTLLRVSIRGETLGSSTMHFRNKAVGLGLASFGFAPMAVNSEHLVVVEHTSGGASAPDSIGARFHVVSLSSMQDGVPVTLGPEDGDRRGFTVFSDSECVYVKEVTYVEGNLWVYSDDMTRLVEGPLRFSEGTDATSFVVVNRRVYVPEGLDVKRIMLLSCEDED